MTSPRRSGPRDNWSLRYISVQQASDRRVRAALGHSLDQVDAALRALEGKTGVGAQVSKAQALGTRATLLEIIDELFKTLGIVIREGQADAAEEAVNAFLQDEETLLRMLFVDEGERKIFMDSQVQKARRNVQAMMTRIMDSERPLSKRVWRSRALARNQVGKIVNGHLARGSSAVDMAKDVRQFVNPSAPGGVSYSAMRLARTEINNAFHSQAINDMQDRPWVDQVEWHLSKSHPPRQPECLCDKYARTKYFPAGDVPKKPHPQCLCYIIPKMMNEAEFLNLLLAGSFREWTAQNA